MARRYLYQIARRRTAFAKAYVWWVKEPLDVGTMREAARAFVGMRDFRSFAAPARARTKARRRRRRWCSSIGSRSSKTAICCCVSIQGSHFLWKMVRRMVGVLVEIGRGGMPPDAIRTMLADGSTAPARLTAPPSGLFLERVFYEGDAQTSAACRHAAVRR